MTRFTFFLLLLLLLFSFNSCDFQTPSEIQIKGSPSFTLTVDMDFSDTFNDLLKTAFNSNNESPINILNCVNAGDIMTFLIHIKIIEFDLSEINLDIPPGILPPGGVNIFPPVPVYNTTDDDDKIILPLNFIEYLEGFEFDEDSIKSKVFISGSDIAEIFNVKLHYEGGNLVEGEFNKIPNDDVYREIKFNNTTASGINPGAGEYSGNSLPSGGSGTDKDGNIIFPVNYLNKDDYCLRIGYEIIAEGNVTSNMLSDDRKTKIEMLIWLPLKFNVSEDGAEFKLVDFDVMGAFFNSLAEAGMIEAITLKIKMNKNPFVDGVFKIKNKQDSDFVIPCPMTSELITFALLENHIKYLNEKDFDPQFIIEYKEPYIVPDPSLAIPNILKLMSVSVDAKLNYTIPLGGDN